MPVSKEKLEKHMYAVHGSFPGSLVNAELNQLKDWHRHQHRVHEQRESVPESDYGKVPQPGDAEHKPTLPLVLSHDHNHTGLTNGAA